MSKTKEAFMEQNYPENTYQIGETVFINHKPRSKRLDANKIVYCDVDETLAMCNLSDYPVSDLVTIPYVNGDCKIIPNKKNINLLTWFHKLGYTVVVWSKTGSDWAEAVGKAIGIDPVVALYLRKPDYYIDDLEASEWMGPRRWRNAK